VCCQMERALRLRTRRPRQLNGKDKETSTTKMSTHEITSPKSKGSPREAELPANVQFVTGMLSDGEKPVTPNTPAQRRKHDSML
jgi:hypothetical protein